MTDQPLINPQGENRENLLVNQIQSQDQNQNYMNPPQNNYTPDQSYNSTGLIDKPQNQISQPTQQPYYPPQNLGAPMVQSAYPPSQGVALPVQQGLSVNNYPPQVQNPNNMPYLVQPVAPANQIQYQNYRNISQIPHKGIYQVDENTFYVSTGCCFKIFPFIFFIVGVGVGSLYFFIPEPTFWLLIFGIIFSAAGLLMFFKMYNNIYFIMGPNTLTIVKKATCGKKTKIYNPGELSRVDFTYDYSYESSTDGGGYMHHYNLIIVPTNEKPDTIFSIGSSSRVFTQEEMGFFLYYINTHIQTKMRV